MRERRALVFPSFPSFPFPATKLRFSHPNPSKMSFALPSWATTPTRTASLTACDGSSIPVDLQAAVVFGAGPPPPGVGLVTLPDTSSPPQVAALVHHANGKAYVIDLGAVSREKDEKCRCALLRPLNPALHPSPLALSPFPSVPRLSHVLSALPSQPGGATFVNGAPIPANKPTALASGDTLTFTSPTGPPAFTFSCEGAGTKRDREGGDGSTAPTSVRASHLLIKHAQSRRPSSWKEEVVTRSPEEAAADCERLRAAILAEAASKGGGAAALAAAFAEHAARESHCSSARAGGDLGSFGRGAMQAAFEGPAFALGVGEMSGVVSSDSGMHLILRTA